MSLEDKHEDLLRRLDEALSFGTTGRDALPTLLKDCYVALKATPSATAMRGECHDAAERDEGCFRAVRAERLLREAEARLSATRMPDVALTALLGWCVEHDGECLGDHPAILEQAKKALATK